MANAYLSTCKNMLLAVIILGIVFCRYFGLLVIKGLLFLLDFYCKIVIESVEPVLKRLSQGFLCSL